MKDTNITPKDLNAKIQRGESITLIDVREPFEAEICQLPNSSMIPLGQFTAKASELSREKETVIYCRSGGRSGDAVRYLISLGYTNVKNLDGGILRWADEVDSTLQKY